MPARFSDPGASVYEFGDEFLVACPSCAQCALVRVDNAQTVRLTCAKCGYAKVGQAQRCAISPAPEDWYFGLPLWLCTSCLGHQLWARNAAHLAFLEDFIAADLRERPVVDTSASFYWRNRHLSSRLPLWMKAAKHREAVLKALSLLRKRLSEVAG